MKRVLEPLARAYLQGGASSVFFLPYPYKRGDVRLIVEGKPQFLRFEEHIFWDAASLYADAEPACPPGADDMYRALYTLWRFCEDARPAALDETDKFLLRCAMDCEKAPMQAVFLREARRALTKKKQTGAPLYALKAGLVCACQMREKFCDFLPHLH